jgi:hypothetical protein
VSTIEWLLLIAMIGNVSYLSCRRAVLRALLLKRITAPLRGSAVIRFFVIGVFYGVIYKYLLSIMWSANLCHCTMFVLTANPFFA